MTGGEGIDASPTRLVFGDVALDFDQFEIRRDGHRVPVEPQVFDVLAYLARHAGRVVTKGELLDAVWGDRFVSESALTSRIKAARRAVGDDGRAQRVIATIHGRGYRFVAEVVEAAPSADAVAAPAEVLLERDRELDALDRALRRALAGRGQTVFVTGEAGIGKSALVRAFGHRAAGDATLLLGTCDDLGTPRPLGPFRDVARALAALGTPVVDEIDGDTLLAQIRACVETHGRAAVVVVEDLHWGDDATLDMLRFLGRRVDSERMLLVGTFRDEDLDVGHPLRGVLSALQGPSCTRLGLEPLSPEAVGALGGDGTDSAAVLAVTGGNPFFVTEVLASPVGGLPPTVRDAVLARVAQLPTETQDALRTIAVVPGRVDRWLVADLDVEASALDPAEHSGMLTGDPSSVWFRHELARRAVEETLTSNEHVRLHTQIAEALHGHGAELARVMHHARNAHHDDLIVAVGPDAVREALDAGAHRQACEHMGEVLARADRLGPDVACMLAIQYTVSLYVLNRFDESLQAARDAVVRAERLGDPEVLARALLALGRAVLWARGPTEAQQAARRALDVLGPDGDRELRTMAHADLARSLGELVTVGSVAEGSRAAVEHATEAVALADELERSDLRGYALTYLGCERLAIGDPHGADDLERAIDLLRNHPRAELAVRACVNAAGATFRAGRFDDAERYVALGLELGADAEFFSGEYRLGLTHASVQASRGDWGRAESELRELLDRPGEPGIMAPLTRSVLARVVARTGRAADAAEILGPAREAAARSDEPRLVHPVTIALVEVAWLDRPDAPLVEIARPAFDLAVGTGNVVGRAELARYLQWAGRAAAPVPDAPEPWRSGLVGDWRAAARQWATRGEPYEQALELVTAGDPDARSEGFEILAGLGAVASLAALRR